jgi:hypothetical protein
MPLHAPGKGRGGRPDPQAARLYKWQWAWSGWEQGSLTIAECQRAVDWACDVWRVPHVPVRMQAARKAYSAYDNSNRTIKLLRCHMNQAMVLHEVAHHIVDVCYGTGFQDHGPAYVGVFADLLIAAGIAPADAILGSLKARKIKYKMPKTSKRKKER